MIPFYKLDQETLNLLLDVLDMAVTLTDIQVSEDVRDDMYNIIGEVHQRFNIPHVVIVQDDIVNPIHDDSSTVLASRKFGRPNFGVIKGSKDNENDDTTKK